MVPAGGGHVNRDMTSRSADPKSSEGSARPSALRGRWLIATRAAWVTLAVVAVVISLLGLPALYAEFRALAVYSPDLRSSVQANLTELGVSVGFYAAYLLALPLALATACFVMAAVIFWRRSDEPMPLFVAMLLVLLGATFSGSARALGNVDPMWERVDGILNALSLAFIILFFFLFPNGRFVPRWTRWLVILIIACTAPSALFPASPLTPENWPDLPYTVFLASWLLVGVFAQVHRYRRVSSRIERQQTKWVVFGFSVALAGYLLVISLQIIYPSLEPGTLADFLGAAATVCLMLLIPFSFAFAVMRYRLYDIDVVINRTLVYGTLTGILALVYFGGVTATQAILQAFTDQEGLPQLVIVASTLAIAALFSPLRRRVQSFIDRRFYRRKYDATKTLAAFNARLRNETDLDALSDDLVGVVKGTMQPEHASLWLRPESVSGGQQTH